MQFYPLFLNLHGKEVLVVGGGAVGARKIASLLMAEPQKILVVEPAPGAALAPLLQNSCVQLACRPFQPEDILGKALVFAATGNRQVNELVADLCEARGTLCNSADNQEKSAFVVPAHFHNGPILAAIGTQGASPALSRRLRQELETWLDNRFTRLAIVLGRLRPLLLSLGLPTEENTRIFRQLVNGPLADLLHQGRFEEALTCLATTLPEPLHPHVGDLLHEL